MGKVILNCDLGENESAEQTERLMTLIGAANVCCGGHAGTEAKTRATLVLAKRYDVMVGAHPGLAVAGGRGAALPSVGEFEALLHEQIESFLRIAAEVEVPVRYVKLHGTLYSGVEADAALADVFIDRIKLMDKGLGVFCLAGGRFAERARVEGLRVWDELFADRGYTAEGGLVPRSQVGAVIEDVAVAAERMCGWLQTGEILTNGGANIALGGDTVCVHSDSPNAVELLEALGVLLN